MLKWIFVMLLGVGLFYVAENWDDITARFAKFGKPEDVNALATNGPRKTPQPIAWSDRDVAGLRLNLPFPVSSTSVRTSGHVSPSIHLEHFEGEAGGKQISLFFGQNNALVGGLMLSWFDEPLAMAAYRENMDVISKNSSSTILNGFRARRSDYVGRSGNPRERVRCALLERANRAWFIEYHAPENDANAEQAFQRIINSAREL